MVQKVAARGRPRSFDTDEVLEKARDVFWQRGFSGTSMDELSAATGLHKPSLYGAFGDKKKLFLAAIDNYLAEVRVSFAEALAIPNLFESLEAVIARAVDRFTQPGAGAGCFMFSTALPEAGGDPEILAAVRGSIEGIERAFFRRFEKAVEAGQIPADSDIQTLTMIMVGTHSVISARARASYVPDALLATGRRAIDLVRTLTSAR